METDEKSRDGFTPEQIMYIQFLAAGKVDTEGRKWTKEDFAKKIGIHPSTLYDWQRLPGFKEAIFNESIGRISEFVPDMVKAQAHKAIKKQDTPAFMALMRQTGLLQADKAESKNENLDVLTIKFE